MLFSKILKNRIGQHIFSMETSYYKPTCSHDINTTTANQKQIQLIGQHARTPMYHKVPEQKVRVCRCSVGPFCSSCTDPSEQPVWKTDNLGWNPADGTSLWNFGNSVYPALPVSFGGDTKSCRSLLSGVYARGSKTSHKG